MKRLLLVFLITLAGCAQVGIQGAATPAQGVFAAKQGYQAALTAAVAYRRLPDCARAAQPCSDKAVVAQLQRADNVTAAALDAAESAVRSPGFGRSVLDSALAAANSALSAFVAITGGLAK